MCGCACVWGVGAVCLNALVNMQCKCHVYVCVCVCVYVSNPGGPMQRSNCHFLYQGFETISMSPTLNFAQLAKSQSGWRIGNWRSNYVTVGRLLNCAEGPLKCWETRKNLTRTNHTHTQHKPTNTHTLRHTHTDEHLHAHTAHNYPP